MKENYFAGVVKTPEKRKCRTGDALRALAGPYPGCRAMTAFFRTGPDLRHHQAAWYPRPMLDLVREGRALMVGLTHCVARSTPWLWGELLGTAPWEGWPPRCRASPTAGCFIALYSMYYCIYVLVMQQPSPHHLDVAILSTYLPLLCLFILSRIIFVY